MTDTFEMTIWDNEVPVIITTSDLEFNIWENDAPVIELKEFQDIVIIPRRRASIF